MKNIFLSTVLIVVACSTSFAQSPADNFGFRATPYYGGTKVLTILWQYSDTEPFPADYKDKYTEIVFGDRRGGPVKPSLAGRFGFYDQMSNGNLNFINASVIGPFMARDIAGTTDDESKVPKTSAAYIDHFYRACLAAEASGFNFRQFDKNSDGTIAADELCINLVNSDRYAHEFFAVAGDDGWRPPSGPAGVPVYNELGYTFSKLLGYVYSSALPTAPPGSRVLNLWFNSNTGDNYSNTLMNTAGAAPAGYNFVKTMGFALQNSLARPANSVPVFTWFNAARRDYLLNTTSSVSAEAAALRSNGYTSIRQEGFIFDPALPQPANTVPLYLWESNGMIGGGQQKSIAFDLASGLHIRTSSLSIGQDCIANLFSIGHEMIHYSGGMDVYGAAFGKNVRYSLIGALINGLRISHPDPMNKIMAGWIEPVPKKIGSRETFEILGTEISKNSKGKAYVFYDPARGKKEFFILEYRYRSQLKDSTALIPLYNLWDRAREDNMAHTSYSGDVLYDPRTISSRYHKIEGYIFKPSNPQPAGTIPIYNWQSSSIGDGFTTTDPRWRGNNGDRKLPDYICNGGVLGYVYDPALPRPEGTLPLYSWFSASRQDNFITTDINWVGTPGVSRMDPDYTCVRLEGYIKQGAYYNYDGAPFSVLKGIPDDGLTIWYVKIGNDGRPLIIEARDGAGNPVPGERDVAVYILPNNRSYGFSQNLFSSRDGVIDVNWPDGTASGLHIEVLTTDLTQPILRVRTR